MIQTDSLLPYTPPADTAQSHEGYLCVYDSLFTPLEQAEPVIRKSLFTHHQLQVKTSHEITINRTHAPGWMLGLIAISILLVCIFLRNKQIRLINLVQAALDHRALDRLLRDTNLTHPMDLSPVALIALLPLSLIGYHCLLSHSSNPLYDILHYLLFLLLVIVIYFTRNGLLRLLGGAFYNSESVGVYIANNYIYHFLYGIVATAMAFFVCYTGDASNTFAVIFCGIICVLLLFRFFKGMQIILTLSKSSKLFLFYYLCILEIVPMAIVAKIAISY